MKTLITRWILPAVGGALCCMMITPAAPMNSRGTNPPRPGVSAANPVAVDVASIRETAWLEAQLARPDRRVLSPSERIDEFKAARTIPLSDVPAMIERVLDKGTTAWNRPPLLLELLFDRLLRTAPAAARGLVERLQKAAGPASLQIRQKQPERYRAAALAMMTAWAATDPAAARQCLTEWRQAKQSPGTDCEQAISAQEFLLNPWQTLETAEPSAAGTHFSAAWQRDPAKLTAWLSDKAVQCTEEERPRVTAMLSVGLAPADPAAAMLILQKAPEAFNPAVAREVVENFLSRKFSDHETANPVTWRAFADLPEPLCSAAIFKHLCWCAHTHWPGEVQSAPRLENMYEVVPPGQRAEFAACAVASAMDTKKVDEINAWTARIGPVSNEAREDLISSFARWQTADPQAASTWRSGLTPESSDMLFEKR